MKKFILFVMLVVLLSFNFGISHVSAEENHKVLILGDSLTVNGGWTDLIAYDHTVVAKVSMDTEWVKARLAELVASGEILEYDTEVVWIGVNGTFYALTGIPEIYETLHSYGIKIVGITQYKHNYLNLGNDLTYRQTDQFNELIREMADEVVDLAVDPKVVDSKGFVHPEITQDGLHPYTSFSAGYISVLVNEALDEIYQTPVVSAPVGLSSHRVLLFGDSLSSTNLNKWSEYITYDHTLVAKGGQTPSWVLEQIAGLVASGVITGYDTAVVWIGVNDPVQAIDEIPQIYSILHSYDIKVIGVTQWLHYCEVGSQTLDTIPVFNEIVRAQADLVLDFAVDPRFVNEYGYINKTAAGDCIHMNWGMTDIVAGAVNGAIDELYAPTQTPEPTVTPTTQPTYTPTLVTPIVYEPVKGVTEQVVVSEVEPVSEPSPIKNAPFFWVGILLLVIGVFGLKVIG